MALRIPAFNDGRTGQYGFEWLRAILEASLVEGAIGPNDLKVSPGASGGMRIDVAAGVALVKGDSGAAALGLSQGLFLAYNDATMADAATLAASDLTNPRVDRVCLRVRDTSDLGTGADDLAIVVLTGTPTAGATLSGRQGAAAIPNDHLRLADVLVPAGSTVISAGNIGDRRPRARGYGVAFKASGDSSVAGSTFMASPGTGVNLELVDGQAIDVAAAAELEQQALAGVDIRAHLRMIDGAGTVTFTQPTGAVAAAQVAVGQRVSVPLATRLIPAVTGPVYVELQCSAAAGATTQMRAAGTHGRYTIVNNV